MGLFLLRRHQGIERRREEEEVEEKTSADYADYADFFEEVLEEGILHGCTD